MPSIPDVILCRLALCLLVCGSVTVLRRITLHVSALLTGDYCTKNHRKVQICRWWPYESYLLSGTAFLPRQAHKPAALAATPAVVIPTTGSSLLAVCLAWLMVQMCAHSLNQKNENLKPREFQISRLLYIFAFLPSFSPFPSNKINSKLRTRNCFCAERGASHT